MTGREKVLAMAREHGWEQEERSSDVVIFTKKVPMIHRKDEDRLTVTFAERYRVISAYYGQDTRCRTLPRPILSSVLNHLLTIGQEKRAT